MLSNLVEKLSELTKQLLALVIRRSLGIFHGTVSVVL